MLWVSVLVDLEEPRGDWWVGFNYSSQASVQNDTMISHGCIKYDVSSHSQKCDIKRAICVILVTFLGRCQH